MKAVVLVGGQGTRLRPLTETLKKELLPLVDRPILHHALDRLVRHGVEEVVLSSSYLEEAFRPFIDERRGSPSISWITEPEPLDTAGAIFNALDQMGGEAFFAMNGDIVTDLDLSEMLAFHRGSDATATIALEDVEDARDFGLVRTAPDGRVLEFREKPREPVSGMINAGTYLLEPAACDGYARDTPISIEKTVFPELIASGRPVFGFRSNAYWMDLGTPEKYRQAQFDALDGKLEGLHYPAPYVGPGAEVHLRSHLGRWVVLGAGVHVEAEAQVDESVVLPGARVGAGARILASILGPNAQVGEGATVVSSIVGESASVIAGASIENARVPSFTEARTPD
ncbi:MAG TPA: NDP-sugar synthase [Actinomycetota bacterium]|nr:NDP-sugar synthase [Actinomycetota bacterium]